MLNKMFNLNKYFLKKKKFKLKTLIIAEISANHSGDKKKFFRYDHLFR